MKRTDQWIGRRCGRLVVRGDVLRAKGERPRVFCRCDCGNEKILTVMSLASGTKSCGCLQTTAKWDYMAEHAPSGKRIEETNPWRAIGVMAQLLMGAPSRDVAWGYGIARSGVESIWRGATWRW